MVPMVTTATHVYCGRRFQPGDEYDCEDHLAPVFSQLGWARPRERAEPQPQPQQQQYETRVLTAGARPTRRRTK